MDDARHNLIDARAVARLLGCSRRHLYRLTEQGRFPRPVKLGRLSRWPQDQVDEWIRLQAQGLARPSGTDASRPAPSLTRAGESGPEASHGDEVSQDGDAHACEK